MHVALVEEARALGLGQDEVGEEEEAEGGVEGEIADEEVGPVFEEGEEREDDPVHEPGGEEGGVGGAEGFVGGEDGEKDGEEGAGKGVSMIEVWEGFCCAEVVRVGLTRGGWARCRRTSWWRQRARSFSLGGAVG